MTEERLTTMELRPYAIDDWAAVREVYDLAKPDEMRGVMDTFAIPALELDPEMMALFRDSEITVMEHAGRLVGFAGSRENSITWLFVHPSFRRIGVATALVRTIVARLEPPVTLNVVGTNVAARAVYERIGFKLEREFTGQFHGRPCPVARLRYESAP